MTATGPSRSGPPRARASGLCSARSSSAAASCSASASPSTFSRLGRRLAGQSFAPDLGSAGFRLHYAFPDTPAWRPNGLQEEFLVFLGASYFRLRAGNQEYGLSAPGLAIGTARPVGEPGSPTGGAFAAGAVQLYEIPSVEEYMDNIVAAFVPDAPAQPGTALRLACGLTTLGAEPVPAIPETALARVISTRFGSAERLRPLTPPRPERRRCVIDFAGLGLPEGPDGSVTAEVSASAGTLHEPVANVVPQPNS